MLDLLLDPGFWTNAGPAQPNRTRPAAAAAGCALSTSDDPPLLVTKFTEIQHSANATLEIRLRRE